MLVSPSNNANTEKVLPHVAAALDISADWLRETVKTISIPRHYVAESQNNRRVASWIEEQLQSWGYQTVRQGEFDNIVTLLRSDEAVILIGAHYDSVPETPGADDNASAVAAMLGCAQAIAKIAPQAAVCFVAFNREEDDWMGSRDFVQNYVVADRLNLREVHILEMVGYCDPAPGTQRLPKGLPVKLARDAGDFLALIANRHSNFIVDPLLSCAKSYVPELPVLGLKIFMGMEKMVKDLLRSDHAPFWMAKIPALMWTDTSEFRNANYHGRSDTPDTLDYDFLRRVTQLLIARVMTIHEQQLG